MNITYRRYTSMIVAFTFLVVGVTGVLAQFLFKNHAMMEIHGWLGVAMVAAGIVHIILNWHSLKNYLCNGRVYLLLVPIILVIGLFSAGGSREGQGMNPRDVFMKLSQATAENLSKTFGKDPESVCAAMKNDGIQLGGQEETIQQIAQRNQKAPDSLLKYFIK